MIIAFINIVMPLILLYLGGTIFDLQAVSQMCFIVSSIYSFFAINIDIKRFQIYLISCLYWLELLIVQ